MQVASHLISGLSTAVEACVRVSSVSYGSHSIGPPSRVAVAKAAYTVSPALHSSAYACATRRIPVGHMGCSGISDYWGIGAWLNHVHMETMLVDVLASALHVG